MKRRKVLIFTTMTAVGFIVSSCFKSTRSEFRSTEEKLPYFNKIVISAPVRVHFIQGDKSSIKVVNKNKHGGQIIKECHGGVLEISWNSVIKWNILKKSEKDVEVYVTSPDLIGVTLKGSGEFISSGKVDSDNLEITLAGSGDILFTDIICDKIKTNLRGSGDIKINNLQCLHSETTLMGSGDIKINSESSTTSDILLKGSGDIEINYNNANAINCKLEGSGDIELSGMAKTLNKQKRGSGDIDINKLRLKQ